MADELLTGPQPHETGEIPATAGNPEEDRRTREFYKYYDPIRSLSEARPRFTNLWSADERAQHRPQAATDRALTAFCQLGALRLATRRAMLFFFDKQYAYVLAEATRTISLQDDHVHDIDDSLWLGATIVPRTISVCEQTVKVMIGHASRGSNRDDANAEKVHIINDLREDTRFCDRPFVTSGPLARFYAGVPITTPAGINIGAYCVLDDEPRDGLSDKHVSFLIEMASNVMSHLDMIRSRAEYERGARMLSSLGTFVNEASKTKANIQHNGVAPPESVASGAYQDRRDTAHLPMMPLASDELDGVPAQTVDSTFQRAADLIRKAAGVDGVMFLDASVRTFGGLVNSDRQHRGSIDSTSATEGGSTDAEQPGTPTRLSPESPPNECRVLGESVQPGHPYDVLREKFFRSLLRRYPRGKLWTFVNAADLEYSDNTSDESVSTVTAWSDAHEASTDTHNRVRSKRKGSKRDEANQIQRHFPGVCSLFLVGMWDQIRERWYAGALVWTYSPLRIFSLGGEVSYVSAFCDSIMAEVGRIEAQIEDKAKSDFISSVSHELRSPLHGILGSVEFLQDMPEVDTSIVSQIDTCSRTLVDIIDHILDFTKINHFAGHSRSSRDISKDTQTGGSRLTHTIQRTKDLGMSDIVISLDKVTEEVAETVYYSHCCSRDSQAFHQHKVEFALNIANGDYHSQLPTGTWKRVCMNVISNSLKYTRSGHISVSLSTETDARKNTRPRAILSVKDTGRGMSREFLENHFFRAFSQEDGLVEGLGLGMSLVAKLVRGCGGTIEVNSAKSEGTEVVIAVPLASRTYSMIEGQNIPAAPLRFKNPAVSVSLIERRPTTGATPGQDVAQDTLIASLLRTARQLGADVVPFTETTAHLGTRMILLTLEDDIPNLADLDAHYQPTIVVCHTFATARRLGAAYTLRETGPPVQFVPQPCGPQRLLRAIEACVAAPLELPIRRHAETEYASPRPLTRPVSPKRVPTDRESLPLATTPDIDTLVPKPAKEIVPTNFEASTSDETKPKKPVLSLLLVDDNHINLQLLCTYAAKQGHHAIAAVNGLEALEAYKSATEAYRGARFSIVEGTIRMVADRPQVILLDLNMPVMDGFTAARHIRAYEQENDLKATVIIALTGLGSEQAKQEALASGIDLFLTKPVRLKELTKILKSIEAVEPPVETSGEKS